MKNKTFWSLIFFAMSYFSLDAQEQLPASQVFAYIESQYQIQISYIEDDVQDLSFALPSDTLTLDQIVEYIKNQPLLECIKLGTKGIVVKRIHRLRSICGFVIDKTIPHGLVGATVEVKSGKKYTTTNQDGYFELNDVKVDTELIIRYLGYKTVSIKVKDLIKNAGQCNSVVLVSDNMELNEIVLRNLFTTGLYKKNDASVLMTKENFGILPGLVSPDVLQAIQELPGVESVNESIADINIRGGSHDQNYINWEGIKMYQSGHFFGLISAFNPQITEKITLVKNGTSAQYTDGVSGSILMEATQETQSEFSGNFSSDMLATAALLHIPLTKGMSLSITGRQSLTQWLNTPTYDAYFNRSFQQSAIQNSNTEQETDFSFYDLSAKWIYQVNNKHKASISSIKLYNKLNYLERTDNSIQKSNLIQQSIGVSAQIKSKWSDRFQTNLQAYFSKYNLEALDDDVTNEQSLYQKNEVDERGIKINVKYKFDDQLIWLNGYNYIENGITNASYVVNPNYQILQKRINRNHGLYSEISYLGYKNTVKAGVRFNYLESLGRFLIEPRISYRRKLYSGLSVGIQGELKHQTTTHFVDLNEDFLGIENRRWVGSDEKIPVIQSKQLDIGFDYQDPGWYIELNGFYKKINNLISESQGFQGQYQFDNFIGESEIAGVEFIANRKWGNDNNIWLSYTYSDQNFLFKELQREAFPGNYNVDHNLSMGSSCNLTDQWNFSIGYTWKSGRYYTNPEQGSETSYDGFRYRVNYGQLNTFQLKNYFRLDVSSGYYFHVNEAKLTLKFGLLNLLNNSNELSRYYIVDSQNENQTVSITRNGLKITPNLSISYDF